MSETRLVKATDVKAGDVVKWHGDWLTVDAICGMPGEDGCFRFADGTESQPFNSCHNAHPVFGCWVEVASEELL